MTSPSITPSLINKCDHQAFINKCDHRAFKNKCDLTGPWLITPRYAVIGARGDAHHDPRVVAGLWEGGGGGLWLWQLGSVSFVLQPLPNLQV